MAIRNYKPTSPARRYYSVQTSDEFSTNRPYKPLVEPLLMEVKPAHPEYAEARRLSEFLLNFLGASDYAVPRLSLLREYIGGSVFRY